ncbi:MAG: hypothetical protein KJZ93_24685 [Caldilineaceae bacterium]|nr:hypothetical protein [Caldilineaceae bacterium]
MSKLNEPHVRLSRRHFLVLTGSAISAAALAACAAPVAGPASGTGGSVANPEVRFMHPPFNDN